MKYADIQDLSNFVLDYAVMLMRSGANTERTVRNVTRICSSFGYEASIAVFQRNITMTVHNPSDHTQRVTFVRHQMPPHLSLSIVNELSALSWETYDTDINLSDLQEKYKDVISKAHSSNVTVLFFTSLAIAAFCELFGGDKFSMIIVFLSTIIAFSLRLFLIKMHFDVRAMILTVSFTASFFSWLIGTYLINTSTLDVAVSTSVLFLIPGVHIINSVTDILDGHVITGIARGISAMILVICIAVGLYATLSLTELLL